MAKCNTEIHLIPVETREQTLKKIRYYLPALTDKQLRMVFSFIWGLQKG